MQIPAESKQEDKTQSAHHQTEISRSLGPMVKESLKDMGPSVCSASEATKQSVCTSNEGFLLVNAVLTQVSVGLRLV